MLAVIRAIQLFLFVFREILVSTQELVNTIRQIQKVSNQNVDTQLWDVINQFDHNKDGFIEADEILEVMHVIRCSTSPPRMLSSAGIGAHRQ
jgi:Ca2+-binding EF-hand superfamily protein